MEAGARTRHYRLAVTAIEAPTHTTQGADEGDSAITLARPPFAAMLRLAFGAPVATSTRHARVSEVPVRNAVRHRLRRNAFRLGTVLPD